MRTVAIINQKGGCGKTTTAINLAAVLADRGHRTLLVDLDPQAHCGAGLAVPPASIEFDIGDAMLKADGFDPDRLLWRVSRNLDLAPSRTKLAALESKRGGLATAEGREHRLRTVLDRVQSTADEPPFEFAIIDCPPSIGLLTYNAITAADEILIPVETSFFSLQGATKQAATIRSLGRRLGLAGGKGPSIRLLATIHDPTHALAQDLRDELGKRFGSAVLDVTIRQDARVRESSSYGQPVIEYAPDSDGAADYRALGDLMLAGLGGTDAAAIEVKATDVPLGARRRAARANPESAADEATATEALKAEPSGADAENDGGSNAADDSKKAPLTAVAIAQLKSVAPVLETPKFVVPNATQGSASQTTDAGSAADQPAVETKPEQPALATLSRVEDLVRRAAALTDRVRDEAPADTGMRTRLRSTNGSMRLVEQMHDTDRRSKSVARLFGVRRNGSRLIFVQPIEIGTEVRVAGDFNGWNADSLPMTRNETLGVHEVSVEAPRVRARYRLVIDGRWTEDQFNPNREWNEFGDLNSVVEAE